MMYVMKPASAMFMLRGRDLPGRPRLVGYPLSRSVNRLGSVIPTRFRRPPTSFNDTSENLPPRQAPLPSPVAAQLAEEQKPPTFSVANTTLHLSTQI